MQTPGHHDELSDGQLLLGRFTILRRLGRGCMGSVYLCSLAGSPGDLLALKVLSTDAASDSRLRARFRKEIQISYRVSHHNVVRAHEFFSSEDMLAYTMEYVDGGTLGNYLKQNPNPPIKQIVSILTQLAQGLEALEAVGVVHRDIKPANILMSSNGDVKITDFTTSFDRRSSTSALEKGTVGTLEYMSPEVLANGWADHRSDIYALGVIGFLLITGRLPFPTKDDKQLAKDIQKKKVEAPRSLRKDCPKWLSDFILKAMARDPQRRYESSAEVLAVLRADRKKKRRGGLFRRLFRR